MDDDLILAQLLCSRLCHDLVGPAGGVGAGLELFAEQGGGGDDTALALARRSAGEVTRRLAFYRAAFGFGGGNEAPVALSALRREAERLFEGGKVDLDWPDPGEARVRGAAGKLILSLVLIAGDALVRGGRVEVGLADLEEGLGVAVAARGPGAAVKDEVAGALSGELDLKDVSARGVGGYLARRLAQSLGAELELDTDGEEPRLALLIPAAGT